MNGEVGETEGRGREEGKQTEGEEKGGKRQRERLMNEMELQPSSVPLNMTF